MVAFTFCFGEEWKFAQFVPSMIKNLSVGQSFMSGMICWNRVFSKVIHKKSWELVRASDDVVERVKQVLHVSKVRLFAPQTEHIMYIVECLFIEDDRLVIQCCLQGHDTTTSAISFAIYMLSRHPEVQVKISLVSQTKTQIKHVIFSNFSPIITNNLNKPQNIVELPIMSFS